MAAEVQDRIIHVIGQTRGGRVVENRLNALRGTAKGWFWAISRPPMYKTRTRHVLATYQPCASLCPLEGQKGSVEKRGVLEPYSPGVLSGCPADGSPSLLDCRAAHIDQANPDRIRDGAALFGWFEAAVRDRHIRNLIGR